MMGAAAAAAPILYPRRRKRRCGAGAGSSAIVVGLLTLLALATTAVRAFHTAAPLPHSSSRGVTRLYAEPPRPSFLSGLFGGGGKGNDSKGGSAKGKQQLQRPSAAQRSSSSTGGKKQPPLTPQKPPTPRPGSFVWPPVAGRNKAEVAAPAGGSKGGGKQPSQPSVRPPLPSALKQQQQRPGQRGQKQEEGDGDEGDVGPLGRVRAAVSGLTERLQTPVGIGPILSKAAFFAVGFLGGGAAGVGFLLAPASNLPENLVQPITLFENILLEIDRGYVEPVDDKRLFESAVKAMLDTLDPYTEFEGQELAKDMREAVSGRYGGVGLVIAGSKGGRPPTDGSSILQQQDDGGGGGGKRQEKGGNKGGAKTGPVGASDSPVEGNGKEQEGDGVNGNGKGGFRDGITVVSAFEGYAYDAGMRVGDRLIAVDGVPVRGRTVDQVRDLLRGPPDTQVKVKFQRAGVSPRPGEDGIELTLTRRLVRVPDVKLTSFLGPPADGIGYIQLASFSQNAPFEIRVSLDLLRANAPNGQLKGLVLDLRGNPGGLLTSAVDVASQLVPRDSEIVSARGRNFPSVAYFSSTPPIRSLRTPLAILVNQGTASAAEIVSGAVQDLDSGVIVGQDRTYGKGLVQNVEPLPFQTALKYTVAKYYTPSGRCIQSVRYTPKDSVAAATPADSTGVSSDDGSGNPQEGDGASGGSSKPFKLPPKRRGRSFLRDSTGGYEASDIPDSERKAFYTRNGRVVKDGGGIEADVKVEAPQASVLEVTLQQQGAFFDFATEWAKTHEYEGQGTSEDNPLVTEEVYDQFKRYVMQQVDRGNLRLDLLFAGSLEPLGQAFEETGYKSARTDLAALRQAVTSEVETEFATHKAQIKEQVQEAILARYLPESILRRLALENDPQVKVAMETVRNPARYNELLKGPKSRPNGGAEANNKGLIAWDEFPSLLKRLTEDPLTSSTTPSFSSSSILSTGTILQTPSQDQAQEEQQGRDMDVEGDKAGTTLAVDDRGGNNSPAKHGAVWPFRARA